MAEGLQRRIEYSDLKFISSFAMEKILDFQTWEEPGEHARGNFRLLLSENGTDINSMNAPIQLLGQGNTAGALFSGYPEKVEIKEERGYRIADIQAVSGTILLDQKKSNRVFQKKVQTYMGIASAVTADTDHSACILPGSDMRTGGTLIQYQETDWRFLKRMASQLGLPLVPDTSYYYPRFYLGLSEGEKRESGEIPSCDMCFDGRYYAVSGFITGAIGAKFPGMNHLVEGVVDTTVSAGERLAYAVFDDSMSWDEKWAYAFDPGQMVADFVTGVVIGEILDGIMAAIQNRLRSIFANYDAAMREAFESGNYSSLRELDVTRRSCQV